MSAHLTEEQIRRFREKLMSPEELLVSDQHLHECSSCQETLRLSMPPSSLLSSLRNASLSDEDHLSYEIMAAYVDHKADEIDREIVEGHIDTCLRCSNELRELQAMAEEAEPQPSLWAAFRGLFELPRFQVVAVTSTLLLVAGSFIFLKIYTRPSSRPGMESAEIIRDGSHIIRIDRNGLHGYKGPLPEALKTSVADLGKVYSAGADNPSRGLTPTENTSGFAAYLLAPVDTATDLTQPVFQWKSIPGALRYSVTITEHKNGSLVLRGEQTEKTSWAPQVPLTRGQEYEWRLEVDDGSNKQAIPVPPEPGKLFRILDQANSFAFSAAKEQVTGSHLLLGLLYDRYGMRQDASREFSTLQAKNPESKVVSRLLRSED